MNKIINLFRKKSVEGILSVFHKAVADLEALAESKRAKAIKHQDKAMHHIDEAFDAEEEADAAEAAADSIKNLINGSKPEAEGTV